MKEEKNIVNPEVLETLQKLLHFCEELCEDIKVSRYYPSMEKARYVISKYQSIQAYPRKEGEDEGKTSI